MAKRFELDLNGLNELMKSEWMQGELNEVAQNMTANTHGYGYRTHVASFVAITNVYPTTEKTYKDTMENQGLLKLMGG